MQKLKSQKREDIFEIGTLCNIKQLLKLPGDTVRVLVEGKSRAKIAKYIQEEPYFKVDIEVLQKLIVWKIPNVKL